MSAPMTPAEELDAAARLLRGEPAPEPHPRRLPPKMPDVYAEPIAAWLETCANDLADARHYVDEPNSCEHALDVARAVLGRTP